MWLLRLLDILATTIGFLPIGLLGGFWCALGWLVWMHYATGGTYFARSPSRIRTKLFVYVSVLIAILIHRWLGVLLLLVLAIRASCQSRSW